MWVYMSILKLLGNIIIILNRSESDLILDEESIENIMTKYEYGP